MDIESKRELQNNNNQLLGLTLNREELLKKLLNDAEIIDAEVS